MLCPKCNLEVSKIMLTKGICEKCYRHNYYLTHREKLIASAKQWATDNPERVREIRHKHNQKSNTGKPPWRPRYEGPCISCGATDPNWKYFVKKMCKSCYRKMDWKRRNPKISHTIVCVDCGGERMIWRKTGAVCCHKCDFTWKRDNIPGRKETLANRVSEYRKTPNGKDCVRRYKGKRRAILAGTLPTLTKQEWADILLKYNYSCAYCGSKEKIELDHVIPISKGGTHTHDNVLPACRKCNATKRDKPLDVFLARP